MFMDVCVRASLYVFFEPKLLLKAVLCVRREEKDNRTTCWLVWDRSLCNYEWCPLSLLKGSWFVLYIIWSLSIVGILSEGSRYHFCSLSPQIHWISGTPPLRLSQSFDLHPPLPKVEPVVRSDG